jgi:hypothetical protein
MIVRQTEGFYAVLESFGKGTSQLHFKKRVPIKRFPDDFGIKFLSIQHELKHRLIVHKSGWLNIYVAN